MQVNTLAALGLWKPHADATGTAAHFITSHTLVDHRLIYFCRVLILFRVVRYLFTMIREGTGSYLKRSPLHFPHQVTP